MTFGDDVGDIIKTVKMAWIIFVGISNIAGIGYLFWLYFQFIDKVKSGDVSALSAFIVLVILFLLDSVTFGILRLQKK